MKKLKKNVIERYEELERLINENGLEIEAAISNALQDKSPRIRWLAAESIGKRKLKNLLPKLLSIISDTDSLTRMYAIESIEKLSPKKEIALSLMNYLEDNDELVRVATSKTLGEIGNKEVLDKLENALSDPSPLVRAYTAEAIYKIANKKSLKILRKYINEENEDRARVGFYSVLYSLGEKDYLDRLLNLMNSDDPEIRGAIANTLQDISLSSTDKKKVISLMRSYLKSEPTILIKDDIEDCIKHLKCTLH